MGRIDAGLENGATALSSGAETLLDFNLPSYQTLDYPEWLTDRQAMCKHKKGPAGFFGKPSDNSERLVGKWEFGVRKILQARGTIKDKSLSPRIHKLLAAKGNFRTRTEQREEGPAIVADMTVDYPRDVHYIANLLLAEHGDKLFKKDRPQVKASVSRGADSVAKALDAGALVLKDRTVQATVSTLKAAEKHPFVTGSLIVATIAGITVVRLLSGEPDMTLATKDPKPPIDRPDPSQGSKGGEIGDSSDHGTVSIVDGAAVVTLTRPPEAEAAAPDTPEVSFTGPNPELVKAVTEINDIITGQTVMFADCEIIGEQEDIFVSAIQTNRNLTKAQLNNMRQALGSVQPGDMLQLRRALDVASSIDLAEIDPKAQEYLNKCASLMMDQHESLSSRKADMLSRIGAAEQRIADAEDQASVLDDVLGVSDISPEKMAQKFENPPHYIADTAGWAIVNGGEGNFEKAIGMDGKFKPSFLDKLNEGTQFMFENRTGKRFLVTVTTKQGGSIHVSYQQYTDAGLSVAKNLQLR